MYAAAARRQAAAAPVPQSSSSALNVLKFEDDERKSSVPASSQSGSNATPGMPSSWQGFDIKTDPNIRKMAALNWADITSSPFVSNSPFEGINGKAPGFPEEHMVTPAADEKETSTTAAPAAAVPSPSTPTEDEDKKDQQQQRKEIEAPTKEIDQATENSDGAEPFEQEQQQPALPQYAEFGPVYHQHPAYQQYYYPQQQQYSYPPSYAQAPYQTPQQPMQQQRGAGFQNHRTRQQQQQQPMSRNSSPAAQMHVEKSDIGASSAMPLSQPANHELLGSLPFFKYSDMAMQSELPTAEAIGAQDRKCAKLFIGHVWSKVPTGAVQWLLDSFAPSGATAFAPQLHFNKEGWFRGCLHVSVFTQDPSALQSLIFSLHKRVLFDHEGVWFAQTEDQQRMLDDYCRRLRQLPQHVRHQKLQSLPCNPLACELARNE